MSLKKIIARYKLFAAEDRLYCARTKALKTNDILSQDLLRIHRTQENYDKALKSWQNIWTPTKK